MVKRKVKISRKPAGNRGAESEELDMATSVSISSLTLDATPEDIANAAASVGSGVEEAVAKTAPKKKKVKTKKKMKKKVKIKKKKKA